MFTCSQEYSYIVTNIEEIAQFCSIESQNVRLGKAGHLEIFNDHKMENFVGGGWLSGRPASWESG